MVSAWPFWRGNRGAQRPGRRPPERGAVALAAVLLFLSAVTGCRDDQARQQPQPEDARAARDERIAMRGELEAADAFYLSRLLQHGVSYGAPENIAEIAPEGTRINRGDVVFKLDLALRQRLLDQANTRLAQAEAGLEVAESRYAVLRAAVEAAAKKETGQVAPYQRAVDRLRSLPAPVPVAEAEAELAQLTDQLAEAREHHAALQELARRGFSPDQAVRQARLDAEIAACDVQRAELRLADARQAAQPTDLAIAEKELEAARLRTDARVAEQEMGLGGAALELTTAQQEAESARAQVTVEEQGMEYGTCLAPADGIVVHMINPVTRSKYAQGDQVYASFRVAAVVGGRDFRFRARADEATLRHVRRGAPVRVRLDAMEDAVLDGRVESFDMTLGQGANGGSTPADLERLRPATFDVVVSLDAPPDGLMPGMSGEVELVDAAGPDAPAAGESGASEQGHAVWLAGHAEPVERAAVFVVGGMGGAVTQIVEPNASVREGEPIVTCDGIYAQSLVQKMEPERTFTELAVEQARDCARLEARRCGALVHAAELDHQVAGLRLERVRAQPLERELQAAELDCRRAELVLARARQILQASLEAGLDPVARVELLEGDVRRAEAELARAMALREHTRRGAPEAELAAAELKLECAAASLADARRLARRSAARQAAQVAACEARHRATCEKYQANLEWYNQRVVRAPASGNVMFSQVDPLYGKRLELGDTMPIWQQCIGHVADLSDMKFVAAVDECQLAHTPVGSRATVYLRALAGVAMPGRITATRPLMGDREAILRDARAGKSAGVNTCAVEIRLEMPADVVGVVLPGMTGVARVAVPHEAASVAALPAEAAGPDDTAQNGEGG